MNPVKFCPRCKDLLRPAESVDHRIFLYACPTCRFQDVVRLSIFEQRQFSQEVYAKRTLPRAWGVNCPVCHYSEVVFFLTKTNEILVLTFACCNENCGQYFRESARSAI